MGRGDGDERGAVAGAMFLNGGGVGLYVKEWTMDRAMGRGASLAGEKASKWVWCWELCGWNMVTC